ncbi:MAG TPA: prepilin-type N-terminal cleavage/methylation domain-containing protein [bacterium]|nr:prepilin-type N-terminal cleavage/methylation domain-containing protein [bacterium]HPO07516.1 prepilin-type N-terminal cleavage/methylation domain-containing protein [bacterium]HQO34328.1 prepilin-type N-terminal cleavage/methylation domain-containing protein [bacterium]HQP97327.1 prepilin-type N-terminal cleavage/methylation domain-containing protein [bacterium]
MRNRFAFTLIELLIVVAIIGILAAIAVPNFLGAQIRAKTARARNDIRTMEKAATMYVIDRGVRPIDCDDPGSEKYLGGLGCGTTSNGAPATIQAIPEFSSAAKFMSFSQYKIFTTPVAYISGPLADPFVKGGALSYNTRFAADQRQSESFTFSSCAADMKTGDWGFFYLPNTNYLGTQYDPSNGLNSRGDIYVANVYSDVSSAARPGRYGFN